MLQWQENAGLSSAQKELWLMDRSLERIFFSHLDILLYPSSLRSSMLSPKTRAFGPNTENWFALSFPSYQDRLSCLSPTALVLLPAGFITWNRTLHGNIHFFAAVRWTTCPLPTLLILAFSKWDGATWVTKMAERMFTLLKRQNQKTLLLMLLLHTWSMVQHGASLLFQHNSLWGHGVTWLWKFLFFTRLFLRQLSLLLSTLIWFRAWLCWQAEDKQPPSLVLPSSPSCWEPRSTPEPAPCSLKTPTISGWESVLCSNKALRRSHTATTWMYWNHYWEETMYI